RGRREAERAAQADDRHERCAAGDGLGRQLLADTIETLREERQAPLLDRREPALRDVRRERLVGRPVRCARADRIGPEEIEILLDGGAAPGRRDHEAPEDVQGDGAELGGQARAHEERADRELGVRPRGKEDLSFGGDGGHEQERRDPGADHRELPQACPGWVRRLLWTWAWMSRTLSPSSSISTSWSSTSQPCTVASQPSRRCR